MGKISIHFYQPIAGCLGYKKAGGYRLEVYIEASCSLRNAVAGIHHISDRANLLAQLEDKRLAAMVAINGRINNSYWEAEVHDGDEVSFFPLHGGG